MTIQSSTFAAGPAQKDGRVWITETHTDSVAGPLQFAYLAANTTNATVVMNARVGLLGARAEASMVYRSGPVL